MLEGRLGVNVEGFGERDIGVEDGEVVVKPWKYHLLYPVLDEGRRNGEGQMKTCRFLLSGEETGETLKLDTVFFQNWYGYQDDIVVRGAKMELIQVMCVSFLPQLFAPGVENPLRPRGFLFALKQA